MMSYVFSNFAIFLLKHLCDNFEYSLKIVRLKLQIICEQKRPWRCPSSVTHIKLNFWIPLLGGWPLALVVAPGGGADLILSVRNIIQPATDTRLGRAAAADTARPWVLTIRGHCLALSITASRLNFDSGWGWFRWRGEADKERCQRNFATSRKFSQYSEKFLSLLVLYP